ncbi:MAG: hypothetical protein JSW65_05525 [Candidatus Bipolaricaulota bacterium]|nr:MAG: hypothetical protein JSW65_05525 [Candidatus Bipolaricaulota bacterium]
MARRERFAAAVCLALGVLFVGVALLHGQAAQTPSSPAASSWLMATVVLPDDVRASMGEATAHIVDRLLLIWIVLSLASVGAVIGDVAHARRAPWPVYLVWVLMTVVFGPLGAIAYFPYGRLHALGTLRRDSRVVRVVCGAMHWATGPIVGAAGAAVIVHGLGGRALAIELPAMLAAGWLVTWLVTQGTLAREARAAGALPSVPGRPLLSFFTAIPGAGLVISLLRLAEGAWPTAAHPGSVVLYAALWAAGWGLALLLVPAIASDIRAGRPTWPPPSRPPSAGVGPPGGAD